MPLCAAQFLDDCLAVSKNQIQKFWRVLTAGWILIWVGIKTLVLFKMVWWRVIHIITSFISSFIASQRMAYCWGFTCKILSNPLGIRWMPSHASASLFRKSCSFHKNELSTSWGRARREGEKESTLVSLEMIKWIQSQPRKTINI